MKFNMAVGLFKSGQFLDVDFDHQFIPTEKHDATYSYKKAFDYFPGVASVGGVIVHVESRDGNTPVKFCQAVTLSSIRGRKQCCSRPRVALPSAASRITFGRR